MNVCCNGSEGGHTADMTFAISIQSISSHTPRRGFRSLLVICLALIAFLGASHLDNFVSLIGALCGVPLAFIFPAAAHYILLKERLMMGT